MTRRIRLAPALLAALLTQPSAVSSAASAQPSQPPASSEAVKDTLGRDTPRGALFGFMAAGRQGNFDVAALYLNTTLRGKAAADLAQQLFVVLDTRLPAHLQPLSNSPDGSLANPLKPDQDIVGTIATDAGPIDVVVERVTRAPPARVWLFSRRTLDVVPEVYDQVHLVPVDQFLPSFLTRPHIAGIRLFEWIAFFVALPFLYYALGLIGPIVKLPGPARLLVLAVAIRAGVGILDLPLVERQFWSATRWMLLVAAVVWFGVMLTRIAETYLVARLDRAALGDTRSLLRLGRRVVDVIVFMAGGLVVLRYYGIDATAALAGLGIGGIAVALSAQKTLENVIGGVSIIFDRAVRVGDSLRIGTMSGNVEFVGLRSTRIRTMDRTVLTIPNGQIATLNIETLSERDKFWFHHVVGVTYETSADRLRSITNEIREHLRRQSRVDDSSIRVRVVGFAPAAIEIEISVYLFVHDWEDFLEMQEQLLLAIIAIVERHGSSLALPTQVVRVARDALLA